MRIWSFLNFKFHKARTSSLRLGNGRIKTKFDKRGWGVKNKSFILLENGRRSKRTSTWGVMHPSTECGLRNFHFNRGAVPVLHFIEHLECCVTEAKLERGAAEANGSERSKNFEGVKGGESLFHPRVPPFTRILRHWCKRERRELRLVFGVSMLKWELRNEKMWDEKNAEKCVLVGWFGLRLLILMWAESRVSCYAASSSLSYTNFQI